MRFTPCAPGRLTAALSHSFRTPFVVLAGCSLMALALPGAEAATPNQYRLVQNATVVDLGLAADTDVKSITLALKVNNAQALEAQVAATVNPGSPSYRKFLTPAQFAAQYGQSPAVIAQVTDYLASQGIQVTKVFANGLLISAKASNAQLAAAFGVAMHRFSAQGQVYQAPSGALTIPAALAPVLQGVTGLSTRPLVRRNSIAQPSTGPSGAEATVTPMSPPQPNAKAQSQPGAYSVLDLARQYNIAPLYNAGITGAGKTIGIVTLAGYNQSDAFAYWQQLGLNVDPNRITDVPVDGGASPDAGPGSEGAGETTLDVEQSGGVAPGAAIRVYIAPNTDGSFVDAFAKAVEENLVDTLSVSWGSPEIFYDPNTLQAFHNVFLQAALQGIPVIASAGDAGAYDINRNPGAFVYPTNSTTLLGVDFPAADPLVLAAGGTTLPLLMQRLHGTISIPAERPWGWDYLRDYMVKWYGQATYYNDYFPVGGGGGVSVLFNRPGFQTGLAGTLNSAAAQSLFAGPALTGSGWQDWFDAPAAFAGRNVPDVSLNADPYTGYAVYANGGWGYGSGGTSFVAPQLNGIFTLIASGAGGRLGWLQPQLYATFLQQGYGTGSPFRAITSGSNLYYQAGSHYNPATGLGSLDVSNLAKSFGAL